MSPGRSEAIRASGVNSPGTQVGSSTTVGRSQVVRIPGGTGTTWLRGHGQGIRGVIFGYGESQPPKNTPFTLFWCQPIWSVKYPAGTALSDWFTYVEPGDGSGNKPTTDSKVLVHAAPSKRQEILVRAWVEFYLPYVNDPTWYMTSHPGPKVYLELRQNGVVLLTDYAQSWSIAWDEAVPYFADLTLRVTNVTLATDDELTVTCTGFDYDDSADSWMTNDLDWVVSDNGFGPPY